MTAFNIIFLVTCYPLVFLLYFFLRNARSHNGWCFGVSLTHEWKKDPEIDKVDVEYRKNLKNTMIVFGIILFIISSRGTRFQNLYNDYENFRESK